MLDFTTHQNAQNEEAAQRWRPTHSKQCIKLIGPEDGPFESFVFTVNESIHSWYERKLMDPNSQNKYARQYGVAVCDDGNPNNLFEQASRVDGKNIKRRSLKMALPIFSLRQRVKVRRQGDDGKDYEVFNTFRQGKDGKYLELSKVNDRTVWQRTQKGMGDLIFGEALDSEPSFEGPSILAGSTASMASQLSNFVDLAAEIQGQCACCNLVGDEFNTRPAALMLKGHFCGGCGGQIHVNHHAKDNLITCPHCKADTKPEAQYSCTAQCGDPRPIQATEVYFRCTRVDGKNKLAFEIVLGKDGKPMKVNPDHILQEKDVPDWAEVFAPPPAEAMQRLIGAASQKAASGLFGGASAIHNQRQPEASGGFGFASASVAAMARLGGDNSSSGFNAGGSSQFTQAATTPTVSGSPISNEGSPVDLGGGSPVVTDPMGGPVSLTLD